MGDDIAEGQPPEKQTCVFFSNFFQEDYQGRLYATNCCPFHYEDLQNKCTSPGTVKHDTRKKNGYHDAMQEIKKSVTGI